MLNVIHNVQHIIITDNFNDWVVHEQVIALGRHSDHGTAFGDEESFDGSATVQLVEELSLSCILKKLSLRANINNNIQY